jgi:hypothetical protein
VQTTGGGTTPFTPTWWNFFNAFLAYANTTVVTGAHTPASSTAPGVTGTIQYDGTYLYVCVGTNLWVRAALTGGW